MNTTTREHIRAFWAGHANAYDDGHGHGVHAMTEQKKWRTLFERHLARACTVLDAGTGTGYCALLLAQMGHKVTALDWSKSMLEAAQKKAAALGLHVDTLLGDIEKTPFADASFDAVTARHVLWTLLQPQDAIQEWSRILKPGGVALVDIALGEPGRPHCPCVRWKTPTRSRACSAKTVFRASQPKPTTTRSAATTATWCLSPGVEEGGMNVKTHPKL